MIYIIIGIIAVFVIVALAVFDSNKLAIFDSDKNKNKEKPKYRYIRKQFILSRVEHEYYSALISAVGSEYYIFVQVYLSTILDNKVKGQDWRAARGHIDRKSVDFVLCDKIYISPKLAIELDDKSHDRLDRQERDREVERILRDAGLPLLRLKNRGGPIVEEIAREIKQTIGGVSNR